MLLLKTLAFQDVIRLRLIMFLTMMNNKVKHFFRFILFMNRKIFFILNLPIVTKFELPSPISRTVGKKPWFGKTKTLNNIE